MENSFEMCFRFKCEHFDDRSGISRSFILSYFLPKNSKEVSDASKRQITGNVLGNGIENTKAAGNAMKMRDRGSHEKERGVEGASISLFDLEQKRQFLKKTKLEGQRSSAVCLTLNDLYLDNVISIYSRRMRIIDYADVATKRYFETECQRSSVSLMLSQTDLHRVGDLNLLAEAHQLSLSCCSNVCTGTQEKHTIRATETCCTFLGKQRDIEDFITALEEEMPGTRLLNADHTKLKSTVIDTSALTNCSIVIVKPHIIREGKLGKLLKDLTDSLAKSSEGDPVLEIALIQTKNLSKLNATCFLEVYRAVAQEGEFNLLVNELSSGLCVSIMLLETSTASDPAQVVTKTRALCGIYDPSISKQIRSSSLRAKYGTDRVRNAVHCTDLLQNVDFEVNFIFSLID